MNNPYGPPDFSLYDQELKSATYEEAKRISDDCEADWFRRNQGVGISWEPTRQMLVCHILNHINDKYSSRPAINALKVAVAVEAVAIAALFIMLLLR